MRWFVCLLASVGFAGCASARIPPSANQPDVRSGTTVIAIAIVKGPDGCLAKVSRELAYVRRGKAVVWEVVNACTTEAGDVSLKFGEGGGLRPHLKPERPNAKVGPKHPDYLQWRVGKAAKNGQYADYEIWLGEKKLDDPRIQVP